MMFLNRNDHQVDDEERLNADFERQFSKLRGRVGHAALVDALTVSRQLARLLRPAPASVTMKASEGRILFSLFGPTNGREADVWVDGSGTMNVVFSGPVEDDEMRLSVESVDRVTCWLNS